MNFIIQSTQGQHQENTEHMDHTISKLLRENNELAEELRKVTEDEQNCREELVHAHEQMHQNH